MKKCIIGTFYGFTLLYCSGLDGALGEISYDGNLRLGVVQIEDSGGDESSTISFGGRVSLSTKPIYGFSAKASMFTTNALFGRDDEVMFLGSNGQSYSILGESYLKFQYGNSSIKAGRQIIDTPYADSDDIGMVPNSFEGYTFTNRDLDNTTILLAWLDKWSGVDAPTQESFRELLEDKGVFSSGVIYSRGQFMAQYWYYNLDDIDLHYIEANYADDNVEFGVQYSDQDRDSSIYGIKLGADFDAFGVGFAYNRVDGVVTNGFGGGPFFTSSEDHTVADVKDQEAKSYSLEYALDRFNIGVSHTDFDKGEDETDYLVSYEVSSNHSLDLIYSDMYGDGSMFRFFTNYRF